jgi:Fur family peroxide stress response transcriptional regulator
MKLDQAEIRRRFRASGLKITPQRMAIYRALLETTSHPTADDLYRQVARIHPMISPNTVYYTLAALQRAGLVCEVNYWRDRTRFDANMEAHHHLICLACRRIDDLEDDALDCLQLSPNIRRRFEVTGHRVEFRGYCEACRRRRNSRTQVTINHHRQSRGRTR